MLKTLPLFTVCMIHHHASRSGESPARYGEIIGPDLNQLAVASSSSPWRVSSAQNPARHERSPTTRWTSQSLDHGLLYTCIVLEFEKLKEVEDDGVDEAQIRGTRKGKEIAADFACEVVLHLMMLGVG
ncbi:hypothetical protein QL285_039075 [Trifolium repens]|nr:hypothetical protein QL285_039075 [Trifolium repens]